MTAQACLKETLLRFILNPVTSHAFQRQLSREYENGTGALFIMAGSAGKIPREKLNPENVQPPPEPARYDSNLSASSHDHRRDLSLDGKHSRESMGSYSCIASL